MRSVAHDYTSPSRKRRKSGPVNRIYNISNIPDDVLSLILSRLPIKDAVRTCVLSKDWEFKWTSIRDLNMNSTELCLVSMKEPKFINVVERVVHHLHSVKTFNLYCACIGEDNVRRMATLISVICRRNVESLQLEILDTNHNFFLPRSLLYCTSLRKLYLDFGMPCIFKVPVKSGFPNLKSLYLQGVQILNDSSNTDTVIFTFPVLKKLQLRECKWLKVKFVEICAPSLRTFTSVTPDKYKEKNDFDYCIKVIGATIHEFTTICDYPENIIMMCSTVTCANLECIFDISRISLGECGLQVRKLLRELSNVKDLSISGVLQAIGDTELGLPLPMFSNLSSLDLRQTLVSYFDGKGLIELLHAAPFLKYLEITLDQDEYDYDSVENLPSCLVHHLEEVMINYNLCMEPAYLVEKFLLKNGAHLKSVCIRTHDNELLENDMVEKLSMFPKASTSLHIFAS